MALQTKFVLWALLSFLASLQNRISNGKISCSFGHASNTL